MKTPTTLKHHPLHPILVEFPIALWVFALAADIAFHAGASDVWRSIALYSMGAGIVGAVVAAVPGLVDLLSLNDPTQKRIGIYHAVLMVVTLILFAINWVWRLNADPMAAGPLVLSIIGVAVLLVGGWLGADLVHEYGVTVEESALHGEAKA
jgi:uncharacterized membrane protein